MTNETQNRSGFPVVLKVIDPDDRRREEIRQVLAVDEARVKVSARARATSLLEPGAMSQQIAVEVLGPGVSRDRLTRALNADGGAVMVLVERGDANRRNEALRGGADEVCLWPAPPDELRARFSAAAERGMIRRMRAIDKRDIEGLLDLSEALTTALDIESTLFLIARRMAKVMNSERCSVILLDEHGEYGFVVATSDDASVRNHMIPVADRYPEILEVIRLGEPLVIGDVKQDPLFADVREIIRDKPLGNTALFPVRIDGRVQGVLHLRGADVRPEGLSRRHLRLGTIVANATSIAVRNARLYQSIRDRAERVLTARVKAERRTRQLEKYQRFFDFSGDGIIIVDGKGRILFANREAEAMLGFEAADITQVGLEDIIARDDERTLQDLLEGFREGQHRRQVDLSIVRTSGEVAVLSLSTASLEPEGTPAEGAEVATIISLRDVTQTRAMERELQSTKDFLENLIESSGDAIVAADMTGTIVIFNEVAEELTGHRHEDVIGKLSVTALYDEGVAHRIGRKLRSPEEGEVGRYQSSRENLVTVDGSRVPISLAAALLYDKAGNEVATVGIFSDLRERIRMEERLSAAQKKLEMSERQAGAIEVAGAAAHELAQPLTAILGSAELMERKLDPESRMYSQLQKIIGECERMHEIVRKIGQIAQYRTKPYLGSTNIVDLDAASSQEEER